jgi:alkylated DNA repair dioxygenase AlkB
MTNGQSRKNWQHMVHKTKRQSKMDNLEKLATYGAQNEEAMKNGQSRKNWQHMVHKTKRQSKMDNLEKTGNIWCTKRRGNDKWTI